MRTREWNYERMHSYFAHVQKQTIPFIRMILINAVIAIKTGKLNSFPIEAGN